MILAITGTPGTGKTSVCKALGLEYLDLNRIVEEKGFYTGVDHKRGSLIADLDRLTEYVWHKRESNEVFVIEGHLAHLLEPEIAIVLRANPSVLAERLKQKGFPPQKIQENVEAETLDIILAEAVELCETVYEVDTSGENVEMIAARIRELIDAETETEGEEESVNGRKKALREMYKPGSVDWTCFIEKVCMSETYQNNEE
jgi:adenylate kinase